MRDASIYIIHPETGEPCDIKEVAQAVGTTCNLIHGRIRRGDRGFQIWRPVGVKAKDVDPGNTSPACKHIKCSENEEIIT